MDWPRNPRIARAQTMDRDNPGIVLAQSIDMYMYMFKRWFKRRMILLHQMWNDALTGIMYARVQIKGYIVQYYTRDTEHSEQRHGLELLKMW
jgi:tRNA A37 threonylcarbamoyladenosine synthetase subunit TsaC/SUA5/YrdC